MSPTLPTVHLPTECPLSPGLGHGVLYLLLVAALGPSLCPSPPGHVARGDTCAPGAAETHVHPCADRSVSGTAPSTLLWLGECSSPALHPSDRPSGKGARSWGAGGWAGSHWGSRPARVLQPHLDMLAGPAPLCLHWLAGAWCWTLPALPRLAPIFPLSPGLTSGRSFLPAVGAVACLPRPGRRHRGPGVCDLPMPLLLPPRDGTEQGRG